MNDRLIDVLHGMTCEGLDFDKDAHDKRISALNDQSDMLIARMEEKAPSMYHELKKRSNIRSKVGPAYSRIVKQRYRQELATAASKQEDESLQISPRFDPQQKMQR